MAIASVRDFSAADLHLVRGFHCGDKPWAIAAAAWIGAQGEEYPKVLDSMARGTRVWLYFTADDRLVGFGALGEARWPPDRIRQTIVVQLAVAKEYQGEPTIAGTRKCSHEILDDLIATAKDLDPEWLVLTVDPANSRAIQL